MIIALVAAVALLVGALAFTIGMLLAAVRAERARSAELMQVVTTMRQQGFTASKPAAVVEPRDEEGEGLARAEQRYVQRRDDMRFIELAAADIQRRVPGISPAKAIAEAQRLRREITDQDSPT